MITLRLDKNGGINKGDVQAFEHDNKSEVYIIQLYKNGEIYDLTNKNIELTMVERKRKIGDMVSLPIYNATEGKVKLEVVSDITKQDGIYDFKLTVKDTTGLIETFPSFQVEIKNDITDSITGEIIQDPNFTILTEGLKALADYNIYKTNALKVPEIEQDIVEINEQLDTKAGKEITKKIQSEINLLSFNRYGDIELPSDFSHNIDFKIFRDKNGIIQHDFNVDELIKDWRVIYISENGDDNNNGDTQEKPKKTLDNVLTKISAIEENNIVIKVLTPILTRNNCNVSITNKIINKNIAIVSDTETNIGSIETTLQWTKNDKCYQTTRSATVDVWDKKNRDFANNPIQYKKVSSLTECNNTKGSWFLDGTTLYVRRLDDLAIDEDIMILLQTGALMFDLQSDIKFICKNLNFLCTHDSNPNIKIYSSQNRGHYIGVNTNYLGSQTMNGLQVENVKYCWNFDCSAIGTFRDGFNYHNYLGKGKSSFAFEYNCIAYNNGVRDTVNNNNNAFTAHDGYRLLRIGNIGFNTKGPVLADVNACYSINYDCTMYDSILSGTPSVKTAYWFDDSGVTEETTQTYLINCSGGGVQTKGINTDGIAKVKIHNFKGNNVNVEVLSYLE